MDRYNQPPNSHVVLPRPKNTLLRRRLQSGGKKLMDNVVFMVHKHRLPLRLHKIIRDQDIPASRHDRRWMNKVCRCYIIRPYTRLLLFIYLSLRDTIQ
jgi:hypothetical protein